MQTSDRLDLTLSCRIICKNPPLQFWSLKTCNVQIALACEGGREASPTFCSLLCSAAPLLLPLRAAGSVKGLKAWLAKTVALAIALFAVQNDAR